MQKTNATFGHRGAIATSWWRSVRLGRSSASPDRASSAAVDPRRGFGQQDTFERKAPVEDPFRGLVNGALVRAIRGATLAKKRKLDYGDVRRLIFAVIDNVGGNVECAYTGRVRQGGLPPRPDDMNLEHVWPQSRGAKGSAKVDMHNILVADAEANRRRGNVPFGEVVTPVWSKGGSVLGFDSDGETVFMPRAEVRGNVARAIFYFSAVYGFAVDAREEAVLRKWDKVDPVDTAELERTKRIENEQGNANAFVVYANLIDRIDDL